MQIHSAIGIPQHILAIDLGPIMVKAMVEEKASLEEATLGARELRRFYALHYKYPDECLSPSKLMDRIWHLHILDTIFYPGDCHAMFGEQLHHFPYLGLRGKEDAILLDKTFDRTKELYRLEFGEDMPQAFNGTICSGGCAGDQPKPKPEPDAPGPRPGLETEARCVSPNELQPKCADSPQPPSEPRPKCSDSLHAAQCAGACSGNINLPERPSLEQYLAQQPN